MRTELGKIKSAEIGGLADYPHLFGLVLDFSLGGGGSGISCGAKYTANLNPNCKWDSPEQKCAEILKAVTHIQKTLEEAGVYKVSDLVGKPVEVRIKNNTFNSFRILKEVL